MKDLFKIDGNIFIQKDNKNFIGKGRIELLENIEIYGSISKAAKHMKMSYKAAWDSINDINTLSPIDLVTKVSGGKGGGGTIITSYAKELIYAFKEIEELNKNYLKTLSSSFNEKLQKDNKKTPSFTRLSGKITNLEKNNKNYEITIKLNSQQLLYSINQEEFVKKKDLKENKEINFLIESSSIVLHKNLNNSSARNILKGKVLKISDDKTNCNIMLDCGEKDIIFSKITSLSLKELKIEKNDTLYAQFKAYNITIL